MIVLEKDMKLTPADIEEDKKTVKEIFEINLKKYKVAGIKYDERFGFVTMNDLQKVYLSEKATVQAVMQGLAKDDKLDTEDLSKYPEHIREMLEFNKSYYIQTEDEKHKEVFTDIGNMAINDLLRRIKEDPTLPPFVYIDDFIVDVKNQVAYYGKYRYLVFLSDENDRGRSRLSSRKGDAHQFLLDTSKLKNKFAERIGDVGHTWAE